MQPSDSVWYCDHRSGSAKRPLRRRERIFGSASERPSLRKPQAASRSETDRKILDILVTRDRPIGLRSLADLVGVDPQALADVHEPHLLREGWLARTWRGRVATDKAKARGRAAAAGSAVHICGLRILHELPGSWFSVG